MRTRTGHAMIFAAALLQAVIARAEPLDTLLAPVPGSTACWQRLYSAEHLARHPQQKVTAIRFSLGYHLAGDPALGHGEYAFSIGMATRQRRGTEGGLCHTDDRGRAICAVECDGGAMSVRPSGTRGSILVELEFDGLRLTECGSEEAFWVSAEPDDRRFLLHATSCVADASSSDTTGE